MFAKVTILSVLLAVATSYPIFKQCDGAWANNQLGYGNLNICQAGCLMSSVSMIINDCHRTIDGKQANPGTLNSWLKGHGGYVQGDLFVWGSVSPFGLGFIGFSNNANDIRNHFNQGHAVILNVNNGGHYVLMTGHSPSAYNVNDPGFNRGSYENNQVVTAGIYARPGGCSSAAIKDEGFLE